MITKTEQNINDNYKRSIDRRLKKTRTFIKEQTNGSLLNNIKWSCIFNLIEDYQICFKIHLLIDELVEIKDQSGFILELTNNSVLTDQFKEFIYFLEIKKITIDKKNLDKTCINIMMNLNFEIEENENQYIINGYV